MQSENVMKWARKTGLIIHQNTCVILHAYFELICGTHGYLSICKRTTATQITLVCGSCGLVLCVQECVEIKGIFLDFKPGGIRN